MTVADPVRIRSRGRATDISACSSSTACRAWTRHRRASRPDPRAGRSPVQRALPKRDRAIELMAVNDDRPDPHCRPDESRHEQYDASRFVSRGVRNAPAL